MAESEEQSQPDAGLSDQPVILILLPTEPALHVVAQDAIEMANNTGKLISFTSLHHVTPLAADYHR
jgi:hypothetical protein